MTWESTAPYALTALVEALEAAPTLEGVNIIDGPRVANAGAREVITIGREDADNNVVAIEGDFDLENMSVSPSRDRYSINCGASVLTGGDDVATARARAYQLVSFVGGVLALDPFLGGVVMNARLGTHVLTQKAGPKGITATVAFTVACDSFTRR